jgi:hypothetical protein
MIESPTFNGKVGEGGWEVVHRLTECLGQVKVEQGGRKLVNTLVEVWTTLEVSETGWEVTKWVVETVRKSEVEEGGGELGEVLKRLVETLLQLKSCQQGKMEGEWVIKKRINNGEFSEGWREGINWLIETTSNMEVQELGREVVEWYKRPKINQWQGNEVGGKVIKRVVAIDQTKVSERSWEAANPVGGGRNDSEVSERERKTTQVMVIILNGEVGKRRGDAINRIT